MSDYDRPRSRSRSFEGDRDDNKDVNAPPPAAAPSGNFAEEEGVKLYLGNLDYSTDETRLREEFGAFGTITDVFLPVDRDSNRPRGFGFITFSTRDEAMRAISEKNETEVDGRMIRVNESRPRSDRGGGAGGGGFNASGSSEVKLFVGNLSFETTSDSLKKHFEEIGEVTDCYMPTDRDTGRPRGFAFVTMKAADAETACSKMNSEEIDGRNIKVNEAMGRERGGGGGGRGGGYRGGGGYGDRSRGGGGYDRGGGGYGERNGGGGYDRSSGGGYDRSSGGGYERSSGGGYDRSSGGGYGRGGGGGGGYRDRDSRNEYSGNSGSGGYRGGGERGW
mmetsp:Transcript_13104/g.18773  ORF Transcript_13104/g.18773 Transcript_13104/m.18773 type:complete len:334 (+) Transcript_13104:145-1146(+)|eukprot:CAMPEP_0184855958 /NCGR_PEP_ID=MMETSP0580-20130426/1119_1 /TAXON_ID=1118495 /ORGANISM="Dactyliosolen fragilissimus" /LENGTH=333 /DNA_ID=CAMNT_0027350677 /DNA_START=145 /DNA_END=1146 /DNA_ORIENTATION=-